MNMRQTAQWRECIWAKRDRQSRTETEIQASLNLGQAAVCSKNGESPYCKGNTIMRFAVGKYGPDRVMVNAKQKARKKKERHRHEPLVPLHREDSTGSGGDRKRRTGCRA